MYYLRYIIVYMSCSTDLYTLYIMYYLYVMYRELYTVYHSFLWPEYPAEEMSRTSHGHAVGVSRDIHGRFTELAAMTLPKK